MIHCFKFNSIDSGLKILFYSIWRSNNMIALVKLAVVCLSLSLTNSFSFHSLYKKFFRDKPVSDSVHVNISTSQNILTSTPVQTLNSSSIDVDSGDQNHLIENDVRNVVIIGSGPSGCTAAIYSARALLKPLVIAGYNAGGQLMLTNDVENFPGYKEAITGPAMMSDLISQAKTFGAEFWMTDCVFINTTTYPFEIKLPNCTITSKSVIIATGAESIWLNAEREEEFKGKGISTCATCDGFIFRNKSVIVIG